MCDHAKVENLKLNLIQVSDGNTRYTCKFCYNVIVINDAKFNREYKRLYEPCKTHSFECEGMENMKNSKGNVYCLWCGIDKY